MADISIAELLEAKERGARIKGDPQPPLQVDGLSDLLVQLRQVIQSQKDLMLLQAESQQRTIDKIIEIVDDSKGGNDRVEKLLLQLLTEQKPVVEKPAYEFDIQRGNSGQLTKIVATPTKLN